MPQQALAPHPVFRKFVESELLPGLGIEPVKFWSGLAEIVDRLAPENHRLLAVRDTLQAKLDAYHQANTWTNWDADQYREFLTEIGYLEQPGEDFQVATTDVDPEIATIAGPQLVVPVSNARFALNAANARWGSLYDALYGTDVISEADGQKSSGCL